MGISPDSRPPSPPRIGKERRKFVSERRAKKKKKKKKKTTKRDSWKELQFHQVPRSSIPLSLFLLPLPVGFALIREANRVWPPRASLNVRNRSQATLKIVEGSEVGGCERANNQPLRLLCLLRWKVINYGLANSGDQEKERERERKETERRGEETSGSFQHRSDRFVRGTSSSGH